MSEVTNREREILGALVELTRGSPDLVFDVGPGEDTYSAAEFPGEVGPPTKDEIRSLVLQGFLEVDQTVQPVWRFWPSSAARELFPVEKEKRLQEALSDPDQRLGVILDAIVEAFEGDPATPLLLLRTNSVDIVRHPEWPIPADVARRHDLSQLNELGLVGWESETEFYPTPAGRMAVRNPAGLLSQRASETGDEQEGSRLREWSEKIRAGDVAVGTATNLTGAVIRALLGI